MPKKRIIIISLVLLFFSSCATIFNSNYSVVEVHTIPKGAEIIIDNKDTIKHTPFAIAFPRSRRSVNFKLIQDTITRNINLPAKFDNTFIFGNVFFFSFGHLIDLRSKKIYRYPKKVYVNFETGEVVLDKIRLTSGEFLQYAISFPLINHFYFKKDASHKSMAGFFGIGGGIEYHVDDQFLSTSVGFSSEKIYLEYGNIPDFDSWERIRVSYINFLFNNKFKIGYTGLGFAYQELNFTKKEYDFNSQKPITNRFRNKGLALSLSQKIIIYNDISVSMLYQPTVFNTVEEKFTYQHYLSLQFIFNFRI